MNGRRLSAVIMLLALFAACLVSAPAFSGEHPWDADINDDRFGGGADYRYDDQGKDTVMVLCEGVQNTATEPSSSTSWLMSVLTQVAIWCSI